MSELLHRSWDAILAKRFADLVGEPLTYLTRCRMELAADLLVEQHTATVADVARAVGYAGFSAAFKRVRGVNPSEFRRGFGSERGAATGEVAGSRGRSRGGVRVGR